ncbi:MAG: hypothetical protein OIN86_08400 [Candidatus Methanoperedens sp.]|nr:hypothetical protein [Candidatus Methanoperedens sp.]
MTAIGFELYHDIGILTMLHIAFYGVGSRGTIHPHPEGVRLSLPLDPTP